MQIHGFASDESEWDVWDDRFKPLLGVDPKVFFARLNYGTPLPFGLPENLETIPFIRHLYLQNFKHSHFGFPDNAVNVLRLLQENLRAFKASRSVAATQVDIVAHSMGGLLARYLPLVNASGANFFSNETYGQGRIHKLITIGTPHLGTPVADAVLASDPFQSAETNACVRNMLAAGGTAAFDTIVDRSTNVELGSGAVGTLRHGVNPTIAAIQAKASYPIGYQISTAMIAATVSPSQLAAVDECSAVLSPLL